MAKQLDPDVPPLSESLENYPESSEYLRTHDDPGTTTHNRSVVRTKIAKYCILCAGPRTGTTFLGEAISNAFEAAWPQEIFNENYAEPKSVNSYDYKTAWRQVRGNFFRFREDALRENVELSYPTMDNQRTLFRCYLDQLKETFANECFLLDIKYTSWHHLDPYWRMPTGPPGLVQLVRDFKIPIVHLKRNLFAQYCSQRLAERSGVWWSNEKAVTVEPMLVNPSDCRDWMADMASVQQLFTTWFEGHWFHSLSYEELIQNDQFTAEVKDAFSHAFEREPTSEFSTSLMKIVPVLSNVVANVEEVVDYFAGSEFELVVLSALGLPTPVNGR